MNSTDERHQLESRPDQSRSGTAMPNSRNAPIAALERAFPLWVPRYRLRLGRGGAIWSLGGEGIKRGLHVLEDARGSLITERRTARPDGAPAIGQ